MGSSVPNKQIPFTGPLRHLLQVGYYFLREERILASFWMGGTIDVKFTEGHEIRTVHALLSTYVVGQEEEVQNASW